MITGVTFNPDATSLRWSQALAEILPDGTVRDYLQIALGYSTTGETMQDCWFLAQGSGRNGKGTVFSPIARALGDYAGELPASAISLDRSRHPYELANLPGKRFVVSSEAGDSITLHHDRLKQLTGGDRVTADAKYQQPITFRPQCKLWLSANRKPRVTDDSPAFWARVRFLPFAQSFAGREDPGLRRALEQDPEHQRAILAWLVAGAVRYYATGLVTPDTIRTATAEYESESDPLGPFIGEALDLDSAAEVRAADLYDHYRQWADQQRLSDRERLTATMFGRLASVRFDNLKTRTGKVFYGIARKTS
jgi:putative DNA primase/helicase